MNLLIAMAGPELPENEGPAAAMADGLPALPVLSAMLASARRLSPTAGWRAGVLAALRGAGSGGAEIPDIAIAARALAAVPGLALCFAAPLHVIAGISRVHLPPGGWLQLDAEESARWVDAFNREFGGDDLHLHDTGSGWLLVAAFAEGARDPSPELLIGQPLARAAAQGDAERALRRLGAEAEMWLAAHALNREREARQLPPLNSLWLWGGGRAVELPPLEKALRAVLFVQAADAWLAGLAAHCGVPLLRAGNWDSVASIQHVLLVPTAPSQVASTAHWQQLETNWFEPAARALRDGSLELLRLQIGGSAWQLPDRSPMRWLRRRRPWYERLRA
jgi:hypothetical protein